MNGANGLEDIIGKLTENPEMMKSLMNVAGSIMNNQNVEGGRNEGSTAPKKCDDYENEHDDARPRDDGKKQRNRKRGDDAENLICLLIALKPYVSEDRCSKIDSIVKILKLVQLSEKTGLLKSLL